MSGLSVLRMASQTRTGARDSAGEVAGGEHRRGRSSHGLAAAPPVHGQMRRPCRRRRVVLASTFRLSDPSHGARPSMPPVPTCIHPSERIETSDSVTKNDRIYFTLARSRCHTPQLSLTPARTCLKRKEAKVLGVSCYNHYRRGTERERSRSQRNFLIGGLVRQLRFQRGVAFMYQSALTSSKDKK